MFSGLALLTTTSNFAAPSLSNQDLLVTYGEQSLLPNWQHLDLDYTSIKSLLKASSESFSAALASLEPIWLEVLATLNIFSDCLMNASETTKDKAYWCFQVSFEGLQSCYESIFNNALITQFDELYKALSVVLTENECEEWNQTKTDGPIEKATPKVSEHLDLDVETISNTDEEPIHVKSFNTEEEKDIELTEDIFLTGSDIVKD